MEKASSDLDGQGKKAEIQQHDDVKKVDPTTMDQQQVLQFEYKPGPIDMSDLDRKFKEFEDGKDTKEYGNVFYF